MSSCLHWCSWGHCQALRKNSAFIGISVWDAILWCHAQQVMSSCCCSWLGSMWCCYKDCKYFSLWFQTSRSKCIFRWSIQRMWCSKPYSFQNFIFLLGSTCWLFLWDFLCLLFSKWHLPEEEAWSWTGIFSLISREKSPAYLDPRVHPMTLNDSAVTAENFHFLWGCNLKSPLICNGTGQVWSRRFCHPDFTFLTQLPSCEIEDKKYIFLDEH